MIFFTALEVVLIMLLYCVPGFIIVKSKKLPEESISHLSKLLLYCFQPFLMLSLLYGMDNSPKALKNMGIFALAALAVMGFFLLCVFLIFRKKLKGDITYRIYTISCVLCNSSFMGVPILNAVIPNKGVVVYSAIFSVIMNLLAWTVITAIISCDTSYISVKKIFLNPTMISLAIALPIFLFGVKFPTSIENMISLMGKMTTPLSMMIIGMRLATVNPREQFLDIKKYGIVFIKMILFPLFWVALSYLFPLPTEVKNTMLVICCCPTASITLNFAELLGKGQKTAANLILLSTILSLATLPLMLFLFM